MKLQLQKYMVTIELYTDPFYMKEPTFKPVEP